MKASAEEWAEVLVKVSVPESKASAKEWAEESAKASVQEWAKATAEEEWAEE